MKSVPPDTIQLVNIVMSPIVETQKPLEIQNNNGDGIPSGYRPPRILESLVNTATVPTQCVIL